MLYGCETWRLSERNKKALKAILFLWPLRISRREIKNEEVKQQMGIEDSIIDDIRRKQVVWYGHL